jgi:hypothetical protein
LPLLSFSLRMALIGGVVENPDGLVPVDTAERMEHIHDRVKGDVRVGDLCGTAGSSSNLGEDAFRLLVAVSGQESLLLSSADPAGKLCRDICFEVEDGIVHELLGDLDCRAQLVSREADLVEGVIGFRIQAVLLHPSSRAVRGNNRNGVRAAGSG